MIMVCWLHQIPKSVNQKIRKLKIISCFQAPESMGAIFKPGFVFTFHIQAKQADADAGSKQRAGTIVVIAGEVNRTTFCFHIQDRYQCVTETESYRYYFRGSITDVVVGFAFEIHKSDRTYGGQTGHEFYVSAKPNAKARLVEVAEITGRKTSFHIRTDTESF